MRVSELIRILQNADIPKDAHVVVGGDVVHDVRVLKGQVVIGNYNPEFMPGRGGETAIVFKKNVELSTGDVVSGII